MVTIVADSALIPLPSVNLLNEGQAHAQIFSVEPSLVADMAELLQIDRKLALVGQ